MALGAVSIPAPRVTGREKSVNLDFIDEEGLTINEVHFESVFPGEMPREKEITITNGGTSNVDLTLQCIASVINPLGSGLDTYLSTFFSLDQVAYANTLDVTVNSGGTETFYLKYLPPSTAVPGEKEWTFNPQINDTESGAPPGWENYRDWLYYDYFTITGNGTAETDYPIEQTITYSVGMMNTDFSDLRFVDEDGTELNYGIYSKTDSSTATFIIELPVLPATPDTARIYVYSGNPNALSNSNLDSVSLFNDTFADASIDTDKWTLNAHGSITGSIVSGEYQVSTCQNGWNAILSQHQANVTLPTAFRILAKTKLNRTAGATVEDGIGLSRSDGASIFKVGYTNRDGNANHWQVTVMAGNYSNLGVGWSTANYWYCHKSAGSPDSRVWDVRVIGTNFSIYEAGVKVCDATTTDTPTDLAIQADKSSSGWPHPTFVGYDDIFLLKYMANPPTTGALSGTWKFVSKNLEIKAGLSFRSRYLPGITPSVKHSVRIGGYVYD